MENLNTVTLMAIGTILAILAISLSVNLLYWFEVRRLRRESQSRFRNTCRLLKLILNLDDCRLGSANEIIKIIGDCTHARYSLLKLKEDEEVITPSSGKIMELLDKEEYDILKSLSESNKKAGEVCEEVQEVLDLLQYDS